jgi:hypothetical protein
MNKVIIGALLGSGLLLAADEVTVDRLSGNERVALETQSPRVRTKGMDRYRKYDREGVAVEKTKPGYRVVSDKSTVVAYIPADK